MRKPGHRQFHNRNALLFRVIEVLRTELIYHTYFQRPSYAATSMRSHFYNLIHYLPPRHAHLLLAGAVFLHGTEASAQHPPPTSNVTREGTPRPEPSSPSTVPPVDSGAAARANVATSPGVLTKAPELQRYVPAPYPEGAPLEQREAVVVLDLLLDAAGEVVDARVAQSAGEVFDTPAVAAARQFQFSPAEIDRVPSPIKLQYRFEFRRPPEIVEKTTLSGTIKRGTTGEPLAGISIVLDTGQRATTDDQGRFLFDAVAPGERTLLLSGENIAALQTSETLEAGKNLAVTYELTVRVVTPDESGNEDIDDLEILVVAPKVTAEVVATRVEAESAKRVAGTQGDVLKVVENMPGVARAAVGSGDVVVWGAAPNDTRVYIDSVRVPALYHFGGFRSVIHSDMVRSVELIPGAYGAAYSRGLGGLITVATADPTARDLQASAQIDLLDASAAASASNGVWGLSVGGRRSHLDQAFSGVLDDRAQQYFAVPKYYDGSLRGRYHVNPRSWLEVGAMASGDEITRSVQSADPTAVRQETRSLYFERVMVRYQTEDDDGAQTTLVPWFGRDRNSLVGQFGSVPVELEGESLFYGLRSNWAGKASAHVAAQVGIDLEFLQSNFVRTGSTSSPAREGDPRVFGQPPADQINTDHWKVTTGSIAPYVEADIALLDDRLHLVPGIRLEPFFANVNRRRPADGGPQVGAFDGDLTVQPRLSVRHRFGKRVQLKGALGVYRQPAQGEDLSSVFGNPLLGNSHATHYLFGADTSLTRVLQLETAAFLSMSDRLAVRNPLPSPRVAEALVAEGEGRSYGMQVMLRRELDAGFMGWIAYTLSRSERRLTADHPWRLFDYDQTHVVTALASYDLGKGFELGARVRAATGYPRTPVVGRYYDSRRDQYEPVLGSKNSTRIPYFVQLDVRASKRWKWTHQELEMYLDVLNTTNRQNPEEIIYDSDYSQQKYINGLPILPVLGLKWSYR